MSNEKKPQLTKEQEALIPVYKAKFQEITRLCTPCDRPKAEAALTKELVKAYPKKITFVWKDSPAQCAILVAQLAKLPPQKTVAGALAAAASIDVVRDDVVKIFPGMSSGFAEGAWVGFYAFVEEVINGNKNNADLNNIIELVKNTGSHWIMTTTDGNEETLVVCSERPIEQHFDDKNRYHNPNGMAVRYKDGTGVYAYKGRRVPNLARMSEVAAAVDAEEGGK